MLHILGLQPFEMGKMTTESCEVGVYHKTWGKPLAFKYHSHEQQDSMNLATAVEKMNRLAAKIIITSLHFTENP